MFWSDHERLRSSTWRELRAIEQSLLSFCPILEGTSIKWYTDCQNCVHIVHRGSTNMDLQNMAFNIFTICLSRNITLELEWIPRTKNEKADYISKMVDYQDWHTTHGLFTHINSMWGPFTVDRFANHINTKLPRFNSVFWNPDTEHVDCFSVRQRKITG